MLYYIVVFSLKSVQRKGDEQTMLCHMLRKLDVSLCTRSGGRTKLVQR